MKYLQHGLILKYILGIPRVVWGGKGQEQRSHLTAAWGPLRAGHVPTTTGRNPPPAAIRIAAECGAEGEPLQSDVTCYMLHVMMHSIAIASSMQ